MFDISSLQYNSDKPNLIAIIFTVLCSLVLGSIIAFTYDKTSRKLDRPDHFLQAMVLITIVAATIIQAIGDSLARGLGMLGALSIIRFRTSVRDPRNVVFIFAAIASGIACGVFGFTIAIVGTIGFCLTAFLLRLSAFGRNNSLVGKLSVELPSEYENFSDLEKILNSFCKKYKLQGYKVYLNSKKKNMLLYDYQIKLKSTYSGAQLLSKLKELENLKVISLSFAENPVENI